MMLLKRNLTLVLLVLLNAYRNNPQAHEITIVVFHPEVLKVSYFHEEQM
jgi:hypothetical protein